MKVFRLTAIFTGFIHCLMAQPIATHHTGVVIDTVKCLRAPQQSYALYLPQAYSSDQSFGVIFFYDPAARGVVPVSQYKDLAERYQLILVCSNNSKNGPMDVSIEAENAVFSDVLDRYAVDNQKLYVSGFSGGARAASFMAMNRKGYAGIIACGAASNLEINSKSSKSVPYIEMVGNKDMNFSEGIRIAQQLEKINHPHSLIIFEGPHQWPPENIYEQALYWQLSRHDSKYTLLPQSSRYFSLVKNLVQQLVDSTDVYMAYLNVASYSSQPQWSSALVDSLQRVIKGLDQFTKQQRRFTDLLLQEEKVKQQVFDRFSLLRGAPSDTAFHPSEWKSYIAGQNRLVKSKNRQESLLGQRMMAMMRAACFEAYAFQFQTSDFFHATLTARLMTLLDDHYRPYLALARTYAARDMKSEAIEALRKSMALGLTEKSILEKDKYFQKLKDDKAFQEILKKLE